MNCTICNKPIQLNPSAAERAAADVTGKTAAYFDRLFTTHTECVLAQRHTIPKQPPKPRKRSVPLSPKQKAPEPEPKAPAPKLFILCEADVKIDTYRHPAADISRAGVGVRATHIKTGIFVDHHTERSVYRNKHVAMQRLQSALRQHFKDQPND